MSISIYVHWPFCLSKCPYCDFNSHVMQIENEKKWLDAYKQELSNYKALLSERKIKSIFFGGGTPSLLSAGFVEDFLNEINMYSNISETEITLEANPTSIEAIKFRDFAGAGINRVSIGVQSFNDKSLKFLGRNHSGGEALKAIEIADRYYDNYSFDLIYALPGQSVEDWSQELSAALKYAKYHLSLYQLTIEKGTAFFKQHKNGEFSLPCTELSVDLYSKTNAIMEESGFDAYEISNYAKTGYECRHNLVYWLYEDYIGIGAGAHGRYTINGNKYASVSHYAPNKWLEYVRQHKTGVKLAQQLSPAEQRHERIIMGLRSNIGLPLKYIQSGKKLDVLLEENLVIKHNDNLKLTARGKLVLNSIVGYLAE